MQLKKVLYQNYLVPQAYEIQYVIHSKLALQTVEKTRKLLSTKHFVTVTLYRDKLHVKEEMYRNDSLKLNDVIHVTEALKKKKTDK